MSKIISQLTRQKTPSAVADVSGGTNRIQQMGEVLGTSVITNESSSSSFISGSAVPQWKRSDTVEKQQEQYSSTMIYDPPAPSPLPTSPSLRTNVSNGNQSNELNSTTNNLNNKTENRNPIPQLNQEPVTRIEKLPSLSSLLPAPTKSTVAESIVKPKDSSQNIQKDQGNPLAAVAIIVVILLFVVYLLPDSWFEWFEEEL